MSSDTLTWLLTKDTSSFVVKRGGVEFAREKFNLMNRNSAKFSGLAAKKAVDISMADKKVALSTKISKKANRPAVSTAVTPLNKGFRAVAHTVKTQTATNFYRADLKRAALARWTQLNRVAKVEKGIIKKSTIKTRRSRN